MAKVALITGATRGIGKAIAIRLANAGFDIALNYRKENDDLTNTKSEIEKAGVDCLPVQGDISSFEDCERIAKEIFDKFGKIDVLVNNAGITKDMLLMRMKPEDFLSVVDVNLIGTFNMTRNVVPYMVKARSGRVVNISSVVGIEGNAGQANYAASKAGIIGFTKSLARELGSRNILVNAVAPGFIETDMTAVLSDSVRDEIAKKISLKRMGTAEDVAGVVEFLCGEASSYVTGTVIPVTGGLI
jgi:3-oxoacyl-[acyl-carrier protein] reductase